MHPYDEQMNIRKAEEVQETLDIGDYRARTQDLTDCTECKIAHH